MNILIVEGAPLAITSRMGAFLAAGHSVTFTDRAEQALSLMRRQDFDLILVDPFAEREWNFAMIATGRLAARRSHMVMLTKSRHFCAGELFQIIPQEVSIVLAPISDRDLVILCEERLKRHAQSAQPCHAALPMHQGRTLQVATASR